MFEQTLLDNSRPGWSWTGIVIQSGLVTAMLLVPMVSPEMLSVILPKALIYVPVKQLAPVEVEVQPAPGARANAPTAIAAIRPAYRPFVAPSRYNNPVAAIVDDASFAPPPFAIGGGIVAADSSPAPGTGIGAIPTAPPPAPQRPDPPKRIRVGGQVRPPSILFRVNPAYPPLAKQARIAGPVRLEGIIAKDGTIQNLQVLSGHPLLAPAALEAVRQWRYRPTLLNGEPVEVIAPIEVNFILSN